MRFVAACVAAALLAGCKSDPKITGVRMVAEFRTRAIDQLRFSLTVGDQPMRSELRPATAASPLVGPQDLIIYLPDGSIGQTAVCQVDGLLMGRKVAQGVPQLLSLRLHQIVTCRIDLDAQMADDGGVFPDAAPVVPDAGSLPDGAVLAPDGPVPDAPLPRDAPPPGVDVPPLPDIAAPVPDTSGAPVDAPLDTAPPIDAPVDTAAPPADLPPPPDTMVVTGCAGGGTRTAFVDRAKYPRIAGCGTPISYNNALGAALTACAPGWHWCKAEDVAGLSMDHPGTVGGSTCGWLDGSQSVCNDRRSSYPRAGCTGAPGMTLSVGGPPSAGLPCLSVDLGCMEPWKIALAFDRWENTSVTRMGGGCLEHAALHCTSMAGGASCWITCCQN
jgi:hypothetical protein